MDKSKYQYEALKWMYEMEILNHPQVVNNIKLNVMVASPRIKEVELLIYREQKAMLVYLELSWLGKKFFKKRIITEVEEILSMLLPTFRFRVTSDPAIMNLAVERVKQALTGGKNENVNQSADNSSQSASSERSPVAQSVATGNPEAVPSDSQKQPETGSDVRQEASPDDSNKES